MALEFNEQLSRLQKPDRGCYDRVRFPQAERRRRFPRPLLCHLPRRINPMSDIIKV